MKVENIQVINHVIDPKLAPASIADAVHMFSDMIPKLQKQTLMFDIVESNEAFANAIRRVFVDELEVKVMNFSIHDLHTDDMHILPSNIQHRIQMIPLVQSIPNDHTFKLMVSNKTRDIQVVYASNIICKQSGARPWFNTNIPICTIRPGKFISIQNIKVDSGFGYDSSVFSLGSFSYECLGVDFGKSSLSQELTAFRIGLRTNGNVDVIDIVTSISSNLKIRLKEIQMLVDSYQASSDDETHAKSLTAKLYVVKNTKASKDGDAVYEIHIDKEYHTIGNLIAKYAYNEDKGIDFVTYKLTHVLSHKVIIMIKTPEYKKVIHNAIDNIINDIHVWQSFIYTSLS